MGKPGKVHRAICPALLPLEPTVQEDWDDNAPWAPLHLKMTWFQCFFMRGKTFYYTGSVNLALAFTNLSANEIKSLVRSWFWKLWKIVTFQLEMSQRQATFVMPCYHGHCLAKAIDLSRMALFLTSCWWEGQMNQVYQGRRGSFYVVILVWDFFVNFFLFPQRKASVYL